MMHITEAMERAAALLESLRPYCERAEIAGSIRRQKPTGIKDIELVVVPRWERGTISWDLFSAPPLLNKALTWAFEAEARERVQWIKPGTSEVIPWEPKRDGKYWRGLLPGGVKLDLFIATPENFGLIYLIRTGSSEFSEAVVTHARRIGRPSLQGSLWVDGEAVPTPEEIDVFRVLGLRYVAPEQRRDRWAVRADA